MPDAFLSYRRKPSAALSQLIKEKLEMRHGLSIYLDVARADSTQVMFPERLMTAIKDSRCFICLLGDTTLESEWVQKEIQRAYDLKKLCIPVFQESYQPPANPSPAVEYLLNHDGVHIFDIRNVLIGESIGNIAQLIPPPPVPRPIWPVLVGVLVVVLGIVGFALARGGGGGEQQPTLTPEPTTVVVAQASDTPAVPTATDALSPTPMDIPIPTPTDTPNTPTGAELLATVNVLFPTQTAEQDLLNQTATQEMVLIQTATASAEAFFATETAAWATLFELTATRTPNATTTLEARAAAGIGSWTDTPTHTPTATFTPTPTNETANEGEPGFLNVMFQTGFDTLPVWTENTGWELRLLENNTAICSSSEGAFLSFGDPSWTNYEVIAEFQFRGSETGSFSLITRMDDQRTGIYHRVSASASNVSTYTLRLPSMRSLPMSEVAINIRAKQWGLLRAEADGTKIRTYFDGLQTTEYELLAANYTNGYIGIEAERGTVICFNSIVVRSLYRSQDALNASVPRATMNATANVRVFPGQGFTAINAAPAGDRVYVITTNEDGTWTYIRRDLPRNPSEGWVATSLLNMEE
jgi:hypothetical protein